jgi:hypothetical protein
MKITALNALIFAMLLGGIAHLMLFQNGYWNDAMWMTSIMSVGIPAILYNNMKKQQSRKSRRRAEKYAEI